jgi:[ribosomal protein S18]-alanine N-acetyltransferase
MPGSRAYVVPSIRRGTRADIKMMLSIENASFTEPHTESELARMFFKATMRTMVASLKRSVVGYIWYRPVQSDVVIRNVVVTETNRRNGIGSLLVQEVITESLLAAPHSRVLAICNETNLDAHLFFKSLGFVCRGIEPSYFSDGESGYRFDYSLREGGAKWNSR